MRLLVIGLATVLVSGCSGDDSNSSLTTPPELTEAAGGGTGGSGGAAGAGGSDGGTDVTIPDAGGGPSDGGHDAPPIDAATGACADEPGAPAALQQITRIVDTEAVPLAVTRNGWLLYRGGSTVSAKMIGAETPSYDITNLQGAMHVDGRVGFFWSSIDYSTNRGDLLVWSGGTCSRYVGNTFITPSMVGASPDGGWLIFADNIGSTSFDLVAATRDLTERQVLVPAMARGGDDTCRPRYGFAGDAIVVGHCKEGSLDATLQVFAHTGDAWTPTQIATKAQPNWSADATGQRIFYRNSGYKGMLWDKGTSIDVDNGVTWGEFTPGGNVLLYLVGDQLRRTPVPDVLPIPLVTNKFNALNEWSPTYSHVLYSTTVDSNNGERRDLMLTNTESFNPTPRAIVDTPSAKLTRSAFTADGQYVMYLTSVNAEGAGTLHLSAIHSTAEQVVPGVDMAAAAAGAVVVFTNHHSDASVYPATVDLNLVRAGSGAAPTLLQEAIVVSAELHFTPNRDAVIYARPDKAGPEAVGIWAHPLP